MYELFSLLERKNLCFKSFHKLCHDFLEEISQENVENLTTFQQNRQSLISVLESLEKDVKIYLSETGLDVEATKQKVSSEDRQKLSALLQEKDSLVHNILDLDLQILKHIDQIKNDTIQKLQSIQKGRKTVSAYKSPLQQVEKAENTKYFDKKA